MIVESDYLSSALAPTASSFFWISAASSLAAPSLTGFGALSTSSFASFRPRPVIARTSLMTAILLPPASVRMTSNSSFSSAAAASPPAAAPPAAATATGAAALTPHYSSSSLTRSATSSTVCADSHSTTCSFVISDMMF